MNVKISKENLMRLLEMAFIGQVVISETLDDEEKSEEYFEALQDLYEASVEAGVKELIHFDDEAGVYMESPDFEKKVFKDVLDAYESKVFFTTLPRQLALRDAKLEYSAKGHYNLTDLYDRVEELEEAYDEEFQKHGVARLSIIGTLPVGLDDDDDEEDEDIFLT